MKASKLDDPDHVAKHDPEGMLDAVSEFPEWWADSWAAGQETTVDVPDAPGLLVVAGMGGSGITGDVVRVAAEPGAAFPVLVVKDYEVPACIDDDTLVVAVSYSGNTEETLTAAAQAADRGATLMTVTSGGKLAEAAEKHGWSRVEVPPDLQPRAALPHLAGRTLGALVGARTLKIPEPETAGLATHRDEWVGDRPLEENPAKSWAHAIHEAHPVAYGSGAQAVAALRFKCQLNENSKMFARHEVLPEANHNDLVPWGLERNAADAILCSFRSPAESQAIRTRFSHLEAAAAEIGVESLGFTPEAGERVGGLLESVMFGDFVSVYTAALRRVDPTPVAAIAGLKDRLAADGSAKAAAARLGL